VKLVDLALDNRRSVAATALLVALPLTLGVAIGNEPRIALPLVLLVALAIWFTVRGDMAWWDMLVFVVAGAYVLDYGFSNIGVPGSVPVPLVDLIAVALLLRAGTRPDFRWPGSLPFVLAAVFIGLTAVRLAVDQPTHGILAIRDATLGLELAFLFVGYWAISEFGLPRFVRVLSVVFFVALAYYALFPFAETIYDASPVVGLQKPVPLFGTFVGGAVVAAAFFFFAIVRPFGMRSYALAAAALPLLALLQTRGLYIAVPVAIGIVWVLGRAQTGARVRRGLATTVGVGALALVVFFPLAPDEGRLGEVSPSFIVSHLATLSGREGPSAGTVEVRKEWFSKVTQRVDESPTGWALGIGLGPDLAFGFEDEGGAAVRKPHNDYLEIYARYGLLGFGLFVGMLGAAFVRIVQGARRLDGLAARFLWFAVAHTVVLCLLAATQPFLAFPYGTVPLFVVLGAALAVAESRKAEALS